MGEHTEAVADFVTGLMTENTRLKHKIRELEAMLDEWVGIVHDEDAAISSSPNVIRGPWGRMRHL